MSPTAHAVLGASSSARWMRCPGSINASKGTPNTSSVYAREGTAAHELGERCLEGGFNAERFIGEIIEIEGDAFEVDQGMADAVQVYLDTVRADYAAGDAIFIEHKFNLERFYPGMFGTNDACVYKPKEAKLIVFDYKHGRGVPVEAKRNSQLRYYGLGAATAVEGRKLKEIEYVIVQPRCDHPDGGVRRWGEEAFDLLEWSGALVEAAIATEDPDAPLAAGTHCKFCPAAPTCSEMEKAVIEACKADFGDNSGEIVLSEPQTLDPDDLARVLNKASLIKDWFRRVEEFAHAQALEGNVPTGYKLVPKRASRKWKDEDTALDFLKGYGLDPEDLYTSKFKTPAQIEKVVGKDNKGDLVRLIEKVSSGSNLAPDSDPRAPIRPNAKDDFEKA